MRIYVFPHPLYVSYSIFHQTYQPPPPRKKRKSPASIYPTNQFTTQNQTTKQVATGGHLAHNHHHKGQQPSANHSHSLYTPPERVPVLNDAGASHYQAEIERLVHKNRCVIVCLFVCFVLFVCLFDCLFVLPKD